jgi:DNA-binding NarL/FixJ family response regulator
MPENQVGIFILCRNGLLRESLARILGKKPDLRVVGTNSTPPKSKAELADLGVEVIVLDSLQFLFEPELCLPSRHPDVGSWKGVAIAMEDDQKQFLTAIQYGVSGYVLREASAVEVVSAIRGVAQGQAVCPPSMTKVLFDFVVSQAPGLPNNRNRCQMSLTNREQQLIPLIGRGLTNKEIAAQLQLSEQTVKNHVHRILRKVGVEDRLSVFEAFQTKTLGL